MLNLIFHQIEFVLREYELLIELVLVMAISSEI